MSEWLPLPNQQQEDKDITEAGEEKESGSHVLHSNLYGNNPSGASEDELVSWLQYPMDDAFDRGYCSDILRHWPASPLATATTTTACNPSALVAIASSSCGGMKLLPQSEEGLAISIDQQDSKLAAGAVLYDHQYSQRLSQYEGVRVDELDWCKQAQQDEGRMYKDVDARRTARQLKHWHYQERQEGRSMNTELGRRATYTQSEAVHTIPAAAKSSSEAALALGASRAAGLVSQAGVEAFNQVRTAFQPTVRRISPFSLMPPSNVYQKHSNFSPMIPTMLPPRIRTFGSDGSVLPSSQPGLIGGSLKLPIPPYPHLPKHPINVRACEGQYITKKKQGSVSHKLSPNMGRGSGASSDKSLESSTTSAMEHKSIEQGFVAFHVSGSDATTTTTTTTTVTTSTSSTSISGAGRASLAMPKLPHCASSIPSSVKKSDGLTDVHSGGSQTSESFKGAISTGKRKMKGDSEGFSEDADGESADVNSSQLARPKRSRAAETHNASERRRRERINEKLRTLGELIPNSSKTDKASLLDEAIEYLKMLQLQLQVMSMRSGVTLSPTVLPSRLTHLPIPQLGAGHPPSGEIMQGGPAASGPAGGGLNIAGSMSYGVNPATSSANPLIISTTNHAHVRYILPAPISTSAAPPGLIRHFQSAAPTSSVSTVEARPIFPSAFQVTSQPFQSVNMEMYNSYLQPRPPPHEHMQQLQRDQQLRRTHEDRHPQQQ